MIIGRLRDNCVVKQFPYEYTITDSFHVQMN